MAIYEPEQMDFSEKKFSMIVAGRREQVKQRSPCRRRIPSWLILTKG